MKHIDYLREEMRLRSIDVGLEEVEVVKNSIPCTGIRVISPDTPEVSPIVYYSADETVEAIADRIMAVMQAEKPEFDLDMFRDPEYVRSHLYLSVSRRNGESQPVLRRELLNMDLIMKLVIGGVDPYGTSVIKVTADLLGLSGITEKEAWNLAEKNSRETAAIKNLAEFIGLPDDLVPPMYIASCNGGNDGASVMCFPDVFASFCETHELKSVIILPSSTQEVIVLPETDLPSMTDLVTMVDEINGSVVDPLLQLDPEVYRYSYQDNAISIAASL